MGAEGQRRRVPPLAWWKRVVRGPLSEFRWVVVLTAGVASVVLGFWGYTLQDDSVSVADRLVKTINLFSLTQLSGTVSPQLRAAQLLAPLTTGYVGLRGISALFREQWSRLRVRLFVRNHVLVCGLGEVGVRLACGFSDRGATVVAIEKDLTGSAVEECREHGVTVLAGTATDPVSLRQAGAAHAEHIVVACGDDSTNSEVAARVRTLTRRDATRPATCHVPSRRSSCAERCANLSSHGRRRAPRAWSSSVRSKVLPTRCSPSPSECRRDVPLGCSSSATRQLVGLFVARAAREWRPKASTERLPITVCGPNAVETVDRLRSRYPAIDKVCDLVPTGSADGGTDSERRAARCRHRVHGRPGRGSAYRAVAPARTRAPRRGRRLHHATDGAHPSA